jgi:hypothetical protein
VSYEQSRSQCRFQPPRRDAGMEFFVDLARTVIGVAAGTLIALAIAKAYVTYEVKQGVKQMERELRKNARG